ncbi:unknown [Crocosphaera subtropica ATCC 51142]|uniref:Two-component response regulator n=1 Tax=Crocosphaera subtropica (strain ATCC 51142 / BH68) TaxID=43989 RepID=B1X1N3_CROS5|nr:diguanylate cyclase [Crocosphaera subtropica]ACB53063.1 unknown [Crocosphaera subtropica ATCC 51142]
MFPQPLTVLIIDDNQEDRFTFKRYLSKQHDQDYQVLEASSGKEGLEILKTVQVDGVLLDFRLSDVDGIEFLKQLQHEFFYSNFAVIMLTGVGNEMVAVEAMKNGAQDYLIKDNLTPESLHKSLYLAVERVKLRRDLEQSEQRFRGTFEQAAVGIYHINLVGEFLRFNQKFSQITGYFSEELQEKTLEEIIFSEDLSTYQKQLKRLLNNQIKTFTLEQRLLGNNNSLVWINLTVSIINKKDSRPDYLMGIVEDIQERKQTEIQLKKANQQLKTIVEQLAKQNQERTLLSRVSQYLQACTNIEEAYKILADLIQPLFPDCSLGIYQLNEQQTTAHLVSYSGDNLNSKEDFRFSDCWALRQGKTHYNDITHHQLFCPHVETDLTTKATLCYPIIAQGKTLGILYVSATDRAKLTPETENLVKTISDYITLSLANLKLREDLKEQSVRDSLTGLFNRRYLYEFLKKEIAKAQRYETEIGIILLDIDHFKQINDNYSHGLGDVVLEEFGEFLRDNIRESDIACRYGGEEFILIFPHASLDNTYQRAEALRRKIKRLHFRYQQHHLNSVTVSVGVANYPQHGLTGEEVVHHADLALYAAKDQGRNRTIVYGEQ